MSDAESANPQEISTTAKPVMPRELRLTLFVLAAAVIAAGGAVIMTRSLTSPSTPDPYASIRIPEDVVLRVPAFALTTASGDTITESALRGRYTVMDFFFTHCPFACPGMAAAMRRVQDETEETNLRLLSISVDGERDTPDRIDGYADGIGADRSRWTFATGDPAVVWAMCEEGLQLPIGADPSTPIAIEGEETMSNIEHPTRLLLVDPELRVIATASFLSDHEINSLINLAREIVD